jgi:hypothetical protein
MQTVNTSNPDITVYHAVTLIAETAVCVNMEKYLRLGFLDH